MPRKTDRPLHSDQQASEWPICEKKGDEALAHRVLSKRPRATPAEKEAEKTYVFFETTRTCAKEDKLGRKKTKELLARARTVPFTAAAGLNKRRDLN